MLNINDFKRKLIKNRPLMGLDYGEKRIGVAISDSSWLIASSHKIVSGIDQLKPIVEGWQITGIVVGYPLEMSGAEGEMAKRVRSFADRLYSVYALPIFLKDERLSSMAAERMMIKELNLSRKRRAETLDKTAAALILQGALDMFQSGMQALT